MNEDRAPFCPISYNQEPTNPRGTAPIRLPSIPIATDLPSLIRAVNIIRDILRTLTTSLTVNNFYEGRVTPSKKYGKRDYLMSDYESDWYQTKIDNKKGFVGKDKKNRAYVERIDGVSFRNNARDNDQSLEWRYPKKLTGEGTKGSPFEEDYFERIVQVHWKKKDEQTIWMGVRLSWPSNYVHDYREGIVDKIATSAISSGYLINTYFVQADAINDIFPVTISAPSMEYAPWTVYSGAQQFKPAPKQKGGMSAPFTMLNFKLNGDPGYYGLVMGTPYGVYGALFTSGVLEPVGSSVVTVNAPKEAMYDGGRWVLQPQLNEFEVLRNTVMVWVAYKRVGDDPNAPKSP